jgi:coenzyme F420-reducing hydrogenase alpha subunit
VADQEKNNVAVYHNRYNDKITFEHIDDKVIMTGGNWFRYGLLNDYSKAYHQYVMDGGHETMEVFEKLVHEYDSEAKSYTELAKKYQSLVFSTNDISMVDPSGGPYISLGNNLKEFWPKGKYQDLIVESIKMASPTKDTDEDDKKSVVIFKIK